MTTNEITRFDNYILSYREYSTDPWLIWNNAPMTLIEAIKATDMLQQKGYQTVTQYNGEQFQ